jgi:hypothetical protein
VVRAVLHHEGAVAAVRDSPLASRIKVELANAQGSSSLYVHESNTTVLRLTNRTGTSILLEPGWPTPDPAPAGVFQLHLYLAALFSDGDSSGIEISAPGWRAQYFAEVEYPRWALTVERQLSWEEGARIELTLANVRPDVRLGTYAIQVELYNLPGVYAVPYTVLVPVERRPAQEDQNLKEAVQVRLKSLDVWITRRTDEPVAGELSLQLANTTAADLVPADMKWGEQDPEFLVSFVYAPGPPGYYALTTPDLAANFEIDADALGWSVQQAESEAQWRLRPDRFSNHAILGTGEAGIARFPIRNVQTQLAPGPTLMYIQYLNVPGYADGFYVEILEKGYRRMDLKGLSVNQRSFSPSEDGPAIGYLTWDVENASLVELSGHGPVSSKGRRFAVKIDRDQRFVLTAYDSALCEILSEYVEVTVDPPISTRWMPCGAIVLWCGAVGDIPPGYALCDGANGTPDLRDRFVLAAGPGERPHTAGAPAHTHGLDGFHATADVVVAGYHGHGMPLKWYARKFEGGDYTVIDTDGDYTPLDQTWATGAHKHGLSVDFASEVSEAQTGGMWPRWYALCYVMKLFPPAPTP